MPAYLGSGHPDAGDKELIGYQSLQAEDAKVDKDCRCCVSQRSQAVGDQNSTPGVEDDQRHGCKSKYELGYRFLMKTSQIIRDQMQGRIKKT